MKTLKILMIAFSFLLVFTVLVFAQSGELPAEFPVGLATLLGVTAPLLIQLVMVKVQNEVVRLFIAVGLSVVTAAVAAVWNGYTFTLSVEFIVAVFTIGQAAFNVFWKPIVFHQIKEAKSGLP